MKIHKPLLFLSLLLPLVSSQVVFADDENLYAEEVPPAGKASENTAAATPVNDFRIEPGVRAGTLLLGMNSRAVLALMGKPTELFQRSEGIEEIVWRTPKATETRVILGADAVIQINVSDPKYRDLLGNGVSSPLKTIFARYRAKGYVQPKQFLFEVGDADVDGYQSNIFDDVEAGVAYHLGVQDDSNENKPPDSLIVHRAGKAALPAKGASLISQTTVTYREEHLQESAAPTPAKSRVLSIPRALGSGLPLTEIVTEQGARAWRTDSVILPGRVFVSALAVTKGPDNQSLWNPIISLIIVASQDRPVWQNVNQVTFSWGYRRLALAASKETVADNSGDMPLTSTVLRVRFPFRDFLDLARAGKFVVSIGGASFPVERAQTLGIRALARIGGASDVSLESGTSTSRSSPKTSAPVSNRAPVGGANEFFPQTRRRTLSQSEVRALSAGDLRLAINEIYARHGLGFKDKELQRRFESLGWYHARDERTIAVIESRLSRIEHANLDLLVAERKRR